MNTENQWKWFSEMPLTGPIDPKKRTKKYNPDKAGDAYLLEFAGNTTTEVLQTTLKRMMRTYTTVGYLGDKQHCYNRIAYGWQGHLWDIAVMRMTYNYLLHEGYKSGVAIDIIKDHIYQSVYPVQRTGRPAGKKGEAVGDGRKSNGVRKVVKRDGRIITWIEIGLAKQVATLIDLMSAYRQHKTHRTWSWSRQKVLTFMSRIKVHPDYTHLHPSNFFHSDI